MKVPPLFCAVLLLWLFVQTGCETISSAVKVAAADRKPLDLYGLVVDQSGQPVGGVKVNGQVLLATGIDPNDDQGLPTETDDHGRFAVHAHGINIGVAFEKTGYLYDPKLSALRPDNYFKSDPTHPVVFTVWKARGAEPTISQSRVYGLVPDGRTYTIDLQDGSKTEGDTGAGDLLVTITRPPGVLNTSQEFDWTFSMTAVGGGFIKTDDIYLNEAPAAGYQNKVTVTMSASVPAQWDSKFQGTYYLQSRGGQVYGHIQIEVISDADDTAILKIDSLVNPGASRDLEVK
jgi:hypothetical protein